jgi:dolichol-phosphate mannosyltransferase
LVNLCCAEFGYNDWCYLEHTKQVYNSSQRSTVNVPAGPRVSIIVPTYNERDNITPLLERIDTALSLQIPYEVIVVDDDSPDGTATIAESFSVKYPVRVVVRKNDRGLASAVVQGFKQAKAPILTVIDADLQHPPEALPALLKELNNGADIAISSRYVPGGTIPRWGLKRKLGSRFAALSARMVLPVCNQRYHRPPLRFFRTR